jgi:hypothetical protein
MEEEYLSIRAFAKEINKSHTWVAEKCKDGFITLQDKKVPKYRALEEIKEHGSLEKEPKNGNKKSKFPPIVQSKERYEFYRANKMEIDLGILRGKIYHKDKLAHDIDKILTLVKKGVMSSAVYAYSSKHDRADAEKFIDNIANFVMENKELEQAEKLLQEFGISLHKK